MIKLRTIIIIFILWVITSVLVFFTINGGSIKFKLFNPAEPVPAIHVQSVFDTNSGTLQSIPQQTYSNQEYGFSFTYPEHVVVQDSKDVDCTAYDKRAEVQHALRVKLEQGTAIPIIFEQQYIIDWYGKPEEAPVFLGVVSHKVAQECIDVRNLVNVTVIKKDKNFKNLSSYVDKKIKEENKNKFGSATGFSVSKLSMEISGNPTLIMRNIAGDAPQNTNDTYFFDNNGYVIELQQSYSGYAVSLLKEEREKDEWAADMYIDYQLGQEVIKGFKLISFSGVDPLHEIVKLDNATIEFVPSTEEEYMKASGSNNPDGLEYAWINKCWESYDQKVRRDCIETKAFKSSPSGIAKRKNDCLFVMTKVGEKKFCDPESLSYEINSDGVQYPYSFYGILPNGLIVVREQNYESASIHLVNPTNGSVTEVYASPIPYTFVSSSILVSYYLNQADGPHGLVSIHEYKNNTLVELYKFTPERWALTNPRMVDDKTFIWKVEDDYDPTTIEKYIRMHVSDL